MRATAPFLEELVTMVPESGFPPSTTNVFRSVDDMPLFYTGARSLPTRGQIALILYTHAHRGIMASFYGIFLTTTRH